MSDSEGNRNLLERVVALEEQLVERDEDFSRRSNLLLDQIVETGDNLNNLVKTINDYVVEARADRETDRERLSLIEMRLDVDRERILECEERFNIMQQNIERILQHLENRYPGNGSG